MSLDMDTTTAAEPQVRAWELLASLAASGQDSAIMHDAQSFVRRAVELMHEYLPCPWGLFLLQSLVEGPVRASWGLDDDQLQQALARNGHRTTADAIEVPLEHEGASAGVLLLGRPEVDTIRAPGFLKALRGQIELLITLQLREAVRQR